MKTNFITAIATFTLLALTCSCSDDLGSNQKLNNGELLFKLQFNSDGNQWKDGSTGTRAAAPLAVNSSEELDEPLYLHIDMEPTTLPAPQTDSTVTRGQRYTGHVFENGITDFRIYGKIGVSDAFAPNTVVAIEEMTGEDADADWRVKENQELETEWEDGDYGNFYAIAPAPPATSGIGYDETNPTVMTFQMKPDESNNYDMLTANAENVSWETKEVELKFRHVMTALRFRVATDNPLTCTINNTTYYIQVKKLKVVNIYDKGSYDLSEEKWTPDPEKTMSECTVNITESHSNMVASGGEHLINTDANCLMLMPQTTHEDAQMRMLCELTTNQDGTGDKISNVVFDVPFGNKELEQGVTYTFTLSKNSNEYYLTSTSNGVSAGPITIPATGDAQDIKVASRMRSSANSDWEPLNWHPEYSRDGGDTWVAGIPEGYMLKDNRGMVVPDINNVSGNAEGEYTWKLEAKRPNFEFASTTALKGKSYTDHDLSLFDLDGTTAINRTTANCYVVNGYGTFKFPVAYGNAIKNGQTNTAAFTERDLIPIFFNYKETHITSPYISTDTGSGVASACLLWQDEENLITPSSVDVTGSGENQYVVFTIEHDNVKAGNAVLAVKDADDNIMWSWHIWVTNLDVKTDKTAVGSTTFSDHLLGWRDPQYIGVDDDSFLFRVVQNSSPNKIEHSVSKNSGNVAAGGVTLHYQYGRKDPFPGMRVSGTSGNLTQSRVYNELKNSGLYTYYPQYHVDNNTWVYDNTYKYEKGSMPLAIQHPNHLFQPGSSAADWMKPYGQPYGDTYTDYPFSGRWNPSKKTTTVDAVKTVYDPCPYGYMIPTYEAINTDLNSVNPGTAVTTEPIPYRTVNGIKLYMPGYIDQNMGVVNSNKELDIQSSYTNAAPFQYYYKLNTSSNSVTTTYPYRALCVLPMVDTDKTTLKPLSFSSTFTCEVPLVPYSDENTTTVIRGFYKEVIDFYRSLGATKFYMNKLRITFNASQTNTATSFSFRFRNNATQWWPNNGYQTFSYTAWQITNRNQRQEEISFNRVDIYNFVSSEAWKEGRYFLEVNSTVNVSSLKFYVTFEIE